MQYLLDTNIILDMLALCKAPPASGEQDIAVVSVLTVMEVLALPGISETEEEQIKTILSRCLVLPVDFEIASLAGRMQRTRKKKTTTDVLIAATAIVHDCVLITRNVRDFKGIPNLKIQTNI